MIVEDFILSIVKRLDKALAKGDQGTVRKIEEVMCSEKRHEVNTTAELSLLAIEHGFEHAARHLYKPECARLFGVLDVHHDYIVACAACSNPEMIPFVVQEILNDDVSLNEAAQVAACDAVEPKSSVKRRRTARFNAHAFISYLTDESLFFRSIRSFPESMRSELFESLPSRKALKQLPSAIHQTTPKSCRRL